MFVQQQNKIYFKNHLKHRLHFSQKVKIRQKNWQLAMGILQIYSIIRWLYLVEIGIWMH